MIVPVSSGINVKYVLDTAGELLSQAVTPEMDTSFATPPAHVTAMLAATAFAERMAENVN